MVSVVLSRFVFVLLCLVVPYCAVGSVSSTADAVKTKPSLATEESPEQMDIQVVFSDVDGTLVHYPDNVDETESGIIALPPSSTGMRGIISVGTLQRCDELRAMGKKLIIISGMRTSTLLKRIPFLPRADAYCCEAGGRIFYPVADGQPSFQLHHDTTPAPFGLREDMEWRAMIEKTAGSYIGNELTSGPQVVPVSERESLLWDFCKELESKGFVVDTKGYSTCFRVNRKHQTVLSDEDFDNLMKSTPPSGLSTSVNLGNIDFYPTPSGKKNCCRYLASKFIIGKNEDDAMNHAICLCDDDNDLEMALACYRAVVPGISSKSMEETIKANPTQILVPEGLDEVKEHPQATERALDIAISLCKES